MADPTLHSDFALRVSSIEGGRICAALGFFPLPVRRRSRGVFDALRLVDVGSPWCLIIGNARRKGLVRFAFRGYILHALSDAEEWKRSPQVVVTLRASPFVGSGKSRALRQLSAIGSFERFWAPALGLSADEHIARGKHSRPFPAPSSWSADAVSQLNAARPHACGSAGTRVLGASARAL